MVYGPLIVVRSHHVPKGIHANAVVVKHETHGAKVEGLGREKVRKAAAERVGTAAGQVADHGVVVRVQGDGADRDRVQEKVGPPEEHEKMRPEIDHVIVEHERVLEVVQERTAI